MSKVDGYWIKVGGEICLLPNSNDIPAWSPRNHCFDKKLIAYLNSQHAVTTTWSLWYKKTR